MALEVRYDGKPIPIEFRDGEASVPEPKEGQKVSFLIKRRDSKERLAAVLLVNGENTLYKQRQSPLKCNKWVLDPEDKQITINGYKLGKDKGEAFRVLSSKESKRFEVNYGHDLGTIALVVFREGKEEVKAVDKLKENEELDVAAIRGGVLPNAGPETLEALRGQLRNPLLLRGAINSGGDVIRIGTEKVKFEPHPTPVMALTVRYYKP